MKNQRLNTLLSISVILIFVLSLFSTVNVHADDSTPPPATEAPVVPVATEVPAATDAPVATDVPTVGTESAPQADSPAEILDSVPAGVDVVVLDQNGEALSLITEEAAHIILNGDPTWCPDGASPGNDPGGDCTSGFYSFNDLITELQTYPSTYYGSGTIYVAYDYSASDPSATTPDAGTNVIFDYGNVLLTDLVVQGGWDFDTLSPTYNTVIGTSTISGANTLQFWDWGGYGEPASLTINDIVFDGGINFGTGVYIGPDPNGSDWVDGNVALNNVSVVGSDYGAYVYADSTTPGNGTVTVTGGNFSDNNSTGLTIGDNGYNVWWDYNPGGYSYGYDLNGPVGGAVNVTDGFFTNNENGSGNGDGLEAYSFDAITLNNILAFDNFNDGANLDNSSGSGDITLNGTNFFDNNAIGGLNIASAGNITLTNVEAYSNTGGDGAHIDNTASTGYNVDIGQSIFDLNGGNGLHILSAGNVTLTDVSASYNTGGNGAFIQNNSATGYNVTIDTNFSDFSYFYGNSTNGLYIASAGNVTLTNVEASGNTGGDGAHIDNTASTGYNVDIDPSHFNGNADYGLYILSAGNVSLTDVEASYNTNANGAYIQNNFATGYNVTIGTNLSTANVFRSNGSDGLYILSAGDVSLANVSAPDNYDYGAFLDTFTSSGGRVSVSNSDFSYNNTSLNGFEAGLYIETSGGATLSGVFALGNLGGNGSEIYSPLSNVKVQDSVFNENFSTEDNYGWGLKIYAGGDVTLINVEASNNSSDGTSGGAYITATGNIFIDPNLFFNNDGPGLQANSNGDITIFCSLFGYNGGYGIDANLPGTLSLTGVTLAGNGSDNPNITGGGTLVENPFECNPGGGKKKLIPPSVGVCIAPATTATYITPKGDFATFPCPINDQASVRPLGKNDLPGNLGDGQKFLSALVTRLTQNNEPVKELENAALISFLIPEGADTTKLAILFWDGTQWTDLGGAVSADGKYFEVSTKLLGTFVLVSK